MPSIPRGLPGDPDSLTMNRESSWPRLDFEGLARPQQSQVLMKFPPPNFPVYEARSQKSTSACHAIELGFATDDIPQIAVLGSRVYYMPGENVENRVLEGPFPGPLVGGRMEVQDSPRVLDRSITMQDPSANRNTPQSSQSGMFLSKPLILNSSPPSIPILAS